MPLKFDLQQYQANWDPLGGGMFVSIQDVLGATSQMWAEVLTEMIKIIPTTAEQLVPIIAEGMPELINAILPPDGSTSPLITGFENALTGNLVGELGSQLPQWESLLITLGPQIGTSLLQQGMALAGFSGGSTILEQLISAGGGTGSTLAEFGSLFAAIGMTFDDLLGLIPGIGSGLSGSTGLGSVFTDWIGLLGSPTGLGTGTPTLPGIGGIPLLGGLLGGGSILGSLIPSLDASKVTTGTFGAGLLQPLIDVISQGFGGGAGLDFTSLQSFLAAIPGAGPILDTMVTTLLGMTGSGFGTPDLVNALISFPARFVTGTLVPGQMSNFGVGMVSNVLPELLVNGTFDTASSILGQNVWTWDGTQGPSGVATSIFATANGTLKEIFSNAVPVAPAQVLNVSGWTKWSSFTGAANSIALTVQEFANGVLQSTTTIGAIAAPGASGGWTQISGSYTVPSGIDTIFLRPVVTAAATAGTVWFGKLSMKPTATTVYNPLIPLLDASKIGSGSFAQSMITNLPTDLTNLAGNTQAVLNSIWQGVFGSAPVGNVLTTDVISALQVIPASSVLGLSGAATIADTITTQVDTLWSGFAKLFGTTGKSITDVAAQASDTVTTANTGLELAEWNNALLGVRNNKSLMQGMDETEESNFQLSDLFSNSTDPQGIISATSASYPVAYWRATESTHKGVISWFGKGFANITALYIDIYKFNYTTNTVELLHSSPDQIGQVTASWSLCQYTMTTANRFDVTNGDVIAVAWRVVGTGTHSIAGKLAGSWLPNHPTVIPAKPAATRTTVGNLAFGSIVYSNNVPWFGIGIASGDVPPDYHAPRTTQIAASGAYTYSVPDWANYVDEIKVGGGGGGHGGDTATGQRGHGGFAGAWDARTLVRGTDFSGTGVTLTGTIGSGGNHGPAAGSGSAGTATTRDAITGGAAASSAAGGAGGTSYGTPKAGGSPGIETFNSVDYPGGTGGSASGSTGGDGEAPGAGGGGGQGGTFGVAFAGGNGARGGAWFVARQT